MTLVWLESWDTVENQTWLNTRLAGRGSSSGGGMVSVTGRHGGNAAVGSGGSGTLFARTGFPTAATYVSGMAVRLNNGSIDHATAHHAITFQLGGVDQMTLRLVEVSTNSEEWRIEVRRGGVAGTILATQTQAQHSGAWHYIEFKVLADPTVGTYEVVLDGVSLAELMATGQDTTGAGSPNIDGHEWWAHPQVSLDDIYILNGLGSANNDFLGPIYVEGILPNGAGNQTNWTPTAAPNWQTVNEPGTGSLGTDYNETATATDVDLYAFANLVNIAGASINIVGVQLVSLMALSAAGSENFNNTFRSDVSEHDAGSQAVTVTTQRTKENVFETNLAESVAWNVADLNAIEFGVEKL